MKIRFWVPTILWIVAVYSPNVWGILPPNRTTLPNYDKRLTAAPAAADASQQQAESVLRARVKDVRISRDAILGTPKLVAASRGFLTGPGASGRALSSSPGIAAVAADPYAPIKSFLNEHSALFGHDARVLAEARIKRDYVTSHNGLHTVVWEQTLDDVPVFDAVLAGHITRNGELVSLSSLFVPNAAGAANAGTPNRASLISSPTISAEESVVRAAANLGVELEAGSVIALGPAEGSVKHQRFRSGLLRGEAVTGLVWLPMSQNSMRLCWHVILTSRASGEMYSVLVDAETGEILVRRCLTNYLTDASYNVFTQESPAPMLPGLQTPGTSQAAVVQRQLVTLSALDTNASPNGWINDGDTETKGNNVDAHTDLNADDVADLPRPSSTNRVFDFQIDLTKQPITYANASVVQLFYWCNWYHDKLYDLGFTEAAGNFQNDNFGRGGVGGDAVQADAQDGSGTDNANFSTPPDGQPGRMQMYVFTDANPGRDGDLDGTVVLHEHTHGLSNRLVGGGVGIFLLQTEGMGEGWSDFYALSLLSPVDADPHAAYPAGGYITYQLGGLTENYYYGIRRYPYSTDLSKNPLTFKDIDPTQADPHAAIPISPIFGGGDPSEVHNQGEVWCVTLWEARANLIDKLGGDEGNTTILQLVTDGMKLAPPNPTFLEARDAIIQADQVDTGGDNYSELWIAFAKRGMGFSASSPTSDTTVGVVEAFDLPPDVVTPIPDGILEVTVNPRSGSALLASDSQPIFIHVTDGPSVTNALISATSTDGTVWDFRNDGVAPDKTANNGTYSALYNVPTNVSSVTITLVISAPGKVTSTNVVTYPIVPLPANDNFAAATKVPPVGASYVSNNRFATTEPGEPAHGGVSTAAASLWWTWSTGTTTNILVDTGGSLVDTVVGVYTGSQVDALTRVASANDIGSRKQAYVTFKALAGTSYKIAVASVNTNNTGTLRVRIVPGGFPDTNSPVVSITSPLSGSVLSTNRIVLSGTAVDPDPNPSGIDKISINITASSDPNVESATVVMNNAENAANSTNWFQLIGLSQGVNTIRVTATDFGGNVSFPAFIQLVYQPRDPINDLFRNATPLTDANGISSVNTLRATKEFGEPFHANNVGGKSVWWTFTPTNDGVLTLSTTNSAFDTIMALYSTNSPGSNVVTFGNLVAIASNDDAYDGVSFSKISQAVRANNPYWIAVDGFDGASGIVYLSYDFTVTNISHLTINTLESGSVSPGSGDYANGSTVVLTATPNFDYEFVGWEGDVTSSANPLPIFMNGAKFLVARFRAHEFSDGFESGGLTTLSWATSGSKPWLVQSNVVSFGQFAARSGVITNSQSSSLSLVYSTAAGVASFDYKVSSETNFDRLAFYVNGNLVQSWSGEAGWSTYQFSVPAATNTFEWRYTKDPSGSAGLDAAFIDNLDLPLVAPSLRLLSPTPGGFQVEFQGPSAQSVRIQASTDLTNWQTLATTNLANGAVIQFTDPQTGSYPFRFYRAVSP
jgi:hypothetical protein